MLIGLKSNKNQERFATISNSLKFSYTVPDGLMGAVLVNLFGSSVYSIHSIALTLFRLKRFPSPSQYIGDREQGLPFITEVEHLI